MKKEKEKDRVEEKKSITLKTSSLKSSNSESSDFETKDDEEYMGLFIKSYNRYMWEQANKYSEKKDHGKSIRLSNSSKDDEKKKSKGIST